MASIKDKLTEARLETKEALDTTKANIKMAAEIAMHPTDK